MKKDVLLLACAAATAAVTAHAFTWSDAGHITGIYVYASGAAYIKTENNQNPDGCTDSHYLVIDPAATRFRELYATAMTAYSTGQTVSINYDGCFTQYPRVNSIAIPRNW